MQAKTQQVCHNSEEKMWLKELKKKEKGESPTNAGYGCKIYCCADVG